jgi:hypothetical protein
MSGLIRRHEIPELGADDQQQRLLEPILKPALLVLPDHPRSHAPYLQILSRPDAQRLNVMDAFYQNWMDPDIAHPKTLRKGDESGSGIKMAPPSDPIYRRGFAFGIIGGKRKGGVKS